MVERATADKSGDKDWASRATTQVESLVELVRDKSVRPILFASRAIVIGVFGVFLLIIVAVAGTVGIVRLFDVDVFSGRVWASDFVIGGIFAGLGVFLWTLAGRTKRSSGD